MNKQQAISNDGRESWLSKRAEWEVGSIYTDDRSRFIVSLVVGYSDEELLPRPHAIEERAKQAAASALALTTDPGSPDTLWFVYDRKTGQSWAFRQDEFMDREVR